MDSTIEHNDFLSHELDSRKSYMGTLPHFSHDFKQEFIQEFNALIAKFRTKSDFSLTDDERRRLISSGVRNFGFLTKASELADLNPQLLPAKFDMEDFMHEIADVNFCRGVLSITREFDRVVSNCFLMYSDGAFRMALRFYRSVQELARAGDPAAIAVFNMLRPFFRRQRIMDSPTEEEVEMDVRSLLHGHKDGKVLVENESPHAAGGRHVVEDDTHKIKKGFKDTVDGEIEV